MNVLAGSVLSIGLLLLASQAEAACARFDGSTTKHGAGPISSWRTDYPADVTPGSPPPWTSVSFKTDPERYMSAVLSTVRTDFLVTGDRLVANTTHNEWWVAPWMDYTSNGREPRMGLTSERGPDAGDLSPTSGDKYQVWAVGFYNRAGATLLGSIFEDECDPSVPVAVRFPEQTASVKFLFTNASPDEVSYLKGAPEFKAYINPDPVPPRPETRPEKRELRTLRLLQVDIAVKDRRADETGWVFGTFIWNGPPTGDHIFDNLVPASLQWGNDPGVYDKAIRESWINPTLDGILYGWKERPFLGFNGRANGPADNLRSSCLSCHATARTPAGHLRLVDGRFDMDSDYKDPAKVAAHVDTWFQNIRGNALFLPNEPARATLDYSLQLDNAIFRLCTACLTGDLKGATPKICQDIGFQSTVDKVVKLTRAICTDTSSAGRMKATPFAGFRSEFEALTTAAPPRQ